MLTRHNEIGCKHCGRLLSDAPGRGNISSFFPVWKLTPKQVEYVVTRLASDLSKQRKKVAEELAQRTVRWRYYKDRDAYVAFTGNVPAFNNVVGFVSRYKDTHYPPASNCQRHEDVVVGWRWEVRDGWFTNSKLIRSGFFHTFEYAQHMVEWHINVLRMAS